MVEPTTPPWTPSPGNEFKTNLGLHDQAGFAKRFEREIMPLRSLAKLQSTAHGLGEATH